MNRLINKILKKKSPTPFWIQFRTAVATRGVCAYLLDEHAVTDTGFAGITHAYANEQRPTVKVFLLPGDDLAGIEETKLVAFEPLNRKSRKLIYEERKKILEEANANRSKVKPL